MSDTSLNRYLGQGNDAAEAAYTPVPVTGTTPAQAVLYVNSQDPTLPRIDWWDGATFVPIAIPGTGSVTNTGALTDHAVIVGNGGTDVSALGSTGTAGQVLTSGGASADPTWVSPLALYINLQDQKTQNTDGGTFTSGAWRTRVLNTEVSDTGSLCTLASNQFTLAAGTYRIQASAPANGCNRNQLRLQNITDTSTVLPGQSSYCDNVINQGNVALLSGVFTIAASKALELQHQCQTTQSGTGFGIASNFTTEIYAMVELWKIG